MSSMTCENLSNLFMPSKLRSLKCGFIDTTSDIGIGPELK